MLLTSTPRDAATVVPDTSTIALEFSAEVAAARVTPQAIRLSSRDGEISTTLQTIGRTVRVTPVRRLAPGELHTLQVDTSLGDTDGNALRQIAQVRFTTAGGSWQAPVYARPGNCLKSGGGEDRNQSATLLDDGSLVLICADPGRPDDASSTHVRTPAGTWQTAPPPPPPAVTGSKVVPTLLRKLSGRQALVVWRVTSGADSRSAARIFDSTTGWGPVLSPPFVSSAATGYDVPDLSTLGGDGLYLRQRVPAPTLNIETAQNEQLLELLPVTGGPAVASVRSTTGPARATGFKACAFPNGDRLVVFEALGFQFPVRPDAFELRLFATFHKTGAGFSPVIELTRQLAGARELAQPKPVCAGNDRARVFWYNQDASLSVYFDWAGAQGWQAAQPISSTNDLTYASQVDITSVQGDDGGGLVAWNDLRADPAALGVDIPGGLGGKRFGEAWLPRLFDAAGAEPNLAPLLGLPLYKPGGTHDTGVVSLAYNPGTKRYVVIAHGGPVGAGKLFLADYSRREGWSNAWTPPGTDGVSAFTSVKAVFNASGQGILLGLRDGQTYLSEWR